MALTRSWRGGLVAVAATAAVIASPTSTAFAQLEVPDMPEVPGLPGAPDAPDTPEAPGGGLPGIELPGGLPLPGIGGDQNEADEPPAGSPGDVPPEVRAARDKLFGPGWDTPGDVRGRAVANTTWLVSYGGNVVLHDSTIEDQLTDTGANKDNNGSISLDDVVAAKPSTILQDHSHFDQQHNAPEVASRTGADLVTDLGGCLFTKETAIEKGIDPALIKCNLIRDENGEVFFTPDSWAGGLPGWYSGQGLDLGIIETTDYGEKGWPERPIPGLGETMAVQLKHSPSFTNRPYPEQLSGPNFDPARSAQDIIEDYKGDPTAIAQNIYDVYAPFDLEGGNVGWLVRYQDFSMFHHGSTGPTNPMEPGAAKIKNSLQELGKNDPIDVELGSVAEMTFLLGGNYFEDQKQYAGAIGAKQFFPVHHYNWYPGWLTNPAATYWPGMKETWDDGKAEFGPGKYPDMCYLTEANYASVWRFKADQWKGDQKGATENMTGPGCHTG